MSGTINLAFTQQFDMDGDPLSGGLLYFFTAGTTTPQSAFQDTALTIVHPNPIILDASGRVPMFYLADGFIKIRLTDKNGVTIIAADQLLVIGPSSGGGGGGGSAGDVTAALQTGDIKARFDWDVKDGFVRCNGRTIGNVGSSATERAEAVCQPLFEYLWTFPLITLQGFAKGANALADWGAGRQLILPDLRGRTIAGLDDMGATAASRLTSTFFGAPTSGATNTALGNVGGSESYALTTAQLASHSHPLNSTNAPITVDASHTHSLAGLVTGTEINPGGGGGINHTHTMAELSTTSQNFLTGGGTPGLTGVSYGAGGTAVPSGPQNTAHSHQGTGSTAGPSGNSAAISGNTDLAGTGDAHRNVQPSMVLTFYMKL